MRGNRQRADFKDPTPLNGMLRMRVWDLEGQATLPCLLPPETSFTLIKKNVEEKVIGAVGGYKSLSSHSSPPQER